MSFALVYLVQRFVFRATDFFHHWYIDGSLALLHALTRVLERTDRWLAVAVSWQKVLSAPRGDDPSPRRFGMIVSRLARFAVGLVAFATIVTAFAACFVLWLTVPLAIPLSALQHLAAP